MHDVCKSEVGLVSTLHLTGTPPYTVHYELVDLSRPHVRPRTEIKRIMSSREELRLEPGPGDWEYRFVKIQDKNYDNIVLPSSDPQFKRRQRVQLVGDAQWKNARQKKIVHACEGETVAVELELKVSSCYPEDQT
jgi:nucleoporin POM152